MGHDEDYGYDGGRSFDTIDPYLSGWDSGKVQAWARELATMERAKWDRRARAEFEPTLGRRYAEDKAARRSTLREALLPAREYRIGYDEGDDMDEDSIPRRAGDYDYYYFVPASEEGTESSSERRKRSEGSSSEGSGADDRMAGQMMADAIGDQTVKSTLEELVEDALANAFVPSRVTKLLFRLPFYHHVHYILISIFHHEILDARND